MESGKNMAIGVHDDNKNKAEDNCLQAIYLYAATAGLSVLCLFADYRKGVVARRLAADEKTHALLGDNADGDNFELDVGRPLHGL